MGKIGRRRLSAMSATELAQRVELRASFAEALALLREFVPPGAERERAVLLLKQSLWLAYRGLLKGANRPAPGVGAVGTEACRARADDRSSL